MDNTTTLTWNSPPSAVLPPAPPTSRAPLVQEPVFSLFGVPITDVTRQRATELLEELILREDGRTHCVFFVNAHTLNLAASDAAYRAVLTAADRVFGDGTGVRWAARMQGTRLRDNVNGTDLLPEFLHATAGRGYRYYLLGADAPTIDKAARYAAANFPGWTQAGYHHGYLSDPATNAGAIEQINRSGADVLLVGMGNPRQESWIHEHRERLHVPLAMGVGGLFDFWAQNVSRAPLWMRQAGCEWLWRLLEQPRDKARRYLLGNPRFLLRAAREALFSRSNFG